MASADGRLGGGHLMEIRGYNDFAEIETGGNAVVYRAFDTQFHRWGRHQKPFNIQLDDMRYIGSSTPNVSPSDHWADRRGGAVACMM